MRILIVDDHELVRKGVRSVLSQRADIEIVGEAANGQEAIQRTLELKPEVIVMDITMPKMNGLEATREILRMVPETDVLILSQHDSQGMIRQALNVGAKGYIDKTAIAAQLLRGIDKIREGQLFFEVAGAGKVGPVLIPKKAAEPVGSDKGEELQQLARTAAQVGSWEWDAREGAPTLSRELQEIFGIDPNDPEEAQIWESRIDPADADRVRRLLQEGYRTGRLDFEYGYRHPVLGSRRLYCKGSRFQNESRMFGVVLDITDRKPSH